jgi:hypothetical protein
VDGAGRAPTGLLLPWLAMATAALVLPWLLYAPAGLGSATAGLGPEASWQALWPVAMGVALAYALRGRVDALPAVPVGDVAAAFGPATRVTLRLGARLDGLDLALRGWTVASVGLVLLAVAIGWALLPG